VPEQRRPKKERSILKVSIYDPDAAYNNVQLSSDGKKAGKKRKASPSPEEPAKKRNKPTPKVTKGRMKGPVDLDKQCGVINDKGLPCSRSLTCKSHSMGAKRSVLGRSKKYDELLLEWQRANNPNFVEPVKRVSKAEKKEKRDKERMEKKRLAEEAAAAMGLDPAAIKKAGAASIAKKSGKKGAAANAALRLADQLRDDNSEDLDDLDSEVEIDELIHSVKQAGERGSIGVPLAVPCDASSWFVQRRERARCCRDLLLNALSSGGGTGAPAGIGSMSLVSRSASHNSGTAGMRLP